MDSRPPVFTGVTFFRGNDGVERGMGEGLV